jgi:RNA polymerase sigma-70 factor (ECF subfamily)
MAFRLCAFFAVRCSGTGLRSPKLEATLARVLAEARVANRGVAVDEAAFLADLGGRVPKGTDAADALEGLRTSDLYLAYACAGGDNGAIAVFEERYAPVVDAVLGRMRLPSAARDEARQLLRHRLFVGDAEARAKIHEYGGRGELASWVRAVAARVGLRAVRPPKGHDDLPGDALDALTSPAEDLEIAYW